MENNINMDCTLTKKIGLLSRTSPFIFLKLDKISDRYRISANYKYLNTTFNLKINYIRDLGKIQNSVNGLFTIQESGIQDISDVFKRFKVKVENNNYCIVYKHLEEDDDTKNSILIFERYHNGTINYSVLFVSTEFFNIDQYLDNK